MQDGGKCGMGEDKEILVPDARPPGKDHDQHTEIHAEEHKHEKRQPLKPHRSRASGVGGVAVGRWQHSVLVVRDRLWEKLWLAWHQTLKIDLSRGIGGCLPYKWVRR
jgi:hypothetical protein